MRIFITVILLILIITGTSVAEIDKTELEDFILETEGSEFYHGTNYEGIIGILETKQIGVEYFDGKGLYLTNEFLTAHNFGQYVLVFKNINEDNLEVDDINDGFFHKGCINMKNLKQIITCSDDIRFIQDTAKAMINLLSDNGK